jgi:putative FmdB family regulatory protein
VPTYEYHCEQCGPVEVFRPVSQYNVPPEHPHPVTRVISACVGFGDIKPYIAVGGDMAGKPITSRNQHRQFLKRNKLVELGNDPIRPTKQMRRTTQKGDVREAMKAAIAEHTRPDHKRGGLIERR